MQELGRNRFTQPHPVQDALQPLNEADVVGIGLAADEMLLNPFEREEQARELFQRLAVKVLQVLKDITPGRVAVDARAFAVKARDGERADLEFVHHRRIQLEFGGVNEHQVPAQRFQMAIANDKAVIVLTDGQTLIRAQNQGQKHPVFRFDQAKLRAFALQPEGPIVGQDFERRLIAFNLDDLLVPGPIQRVQQRHAARTEEILQERAAILGEFLLILLPMGISQRGVKERLKGVGLKLLLRIEQILEIILVSQRHGGQLILRTAQEFEELANRGHTF